VELKRTNKAIFSQPVSDLLEALSSVGFFEESMLVGSWVMPLYQEFFGMSYALRTMDIDFAVQLLQGERPRRIDLQGLIVSQGFTPFITQSGIQKFSREGFYDRVHCSQARRARRRPRICPRMEYHRYTALLCQHYDRFPLYG